MRGARHIEAISIVLQRRAGAMAEDRDFYLDVFRRGPPSFVTDQWGCIEDVNPAGAHLLGIAQQYLNRKPFATYLAPAGRREFRMRLNQAALAPQEPFDVTLRHRDGSERPARLRSASLPGERTRFSSAVQPL